MRLRLPRWLRRTPAPLGRHMRGVAPVTVPGAGAALVSSAAESYLLVEPRGVVGATPIDPPDGEPVTTESHPEPADPAVEGLPPATLGDLGGVSEPGDAAEDASGYAAPAADGQEEPAEATVALGFADGAVLELAPDDPRAAGFRDVAAAVLGHGAP